MSIISKIHHKFWPSIGLKRFSKYAYWRVLRGFGSPVSIALGAAFGGLVGWAPLVGLHNIIGLIVPLIFRFNWVSSLIILNIISSPWTIPLVTSFDYYLGVNILHRQNTFDFSQALHFSYLIHHLDTFFIPAFIGGLIMGIPTALILYFVVYKAVYTYQKNRIHRMVEARKKHEQ